MLSTDPGVFSGLAALVAVGLSTSSAAATVQSPGIVEAIEDVVIRSTVPGTIDRYAFDEGGRVQPQEVVVILENRLQQLEVARRKLIWESLVELEAARAQLELAQNDLEATRKLFETTQSVSREELDLKALDARLAQAEVDRFQVAEEREKIEFEIAEEQLNLRLLKSPIKGIVTKHFMAAGETTEGQEPLVRIVDLALCPRFQRRCDSDRSIACGAAGGGRGPGWRGRADSGRGGHVCLACGGSFQRATGGEG